MIDDRTPNLNLPLPHPDNELQDDVLRLRDSFSTLDAKIAALDALLASDDVDLDTIQELVNAIKDGATDIAGHIASTSNPHNVTAAQVGIATSLALGTIKVGAGLNVSGDGTLSVAIDQGAVTFTEFLFTATAGQTSFSIAGGYVPGFLKVLLNGVELNGGEDYTANNGTSVVLATGAAAGDSVKVTRFTTFSVANAYTKAEVDAALASKLAASGGTATGLKYTRDDDGTISGGTWAIDYANGPVIKATAGANITSITMSNWPASGTAGHLRLMLNAAGFSITFPAWKWIKSDLTATTTFADLGLTLPSGVALIDLFSDDGGTNIYASVVRG